MHRTHLSLLFLAALSPTFGQTSGGVVPCSSTAVSPHIAFGAGWSTTIYISVDSAEAVTSQTITLRFFNAAGAPMQAPVTSTSGLSGRVSEITLGMKQGTEVVDLLGTDGQLSVGWAIAKCTGSVKPQISEVFRSTVPGRPDFEAAVPFTEVPTISPGMGMNLALPNRFYPQALPDLDLSRSVTFPFDSRNGLETGIGVMNPIATALSGSSVGILCYSGSTLIAQKPDLLVDRTTYGSWVLSSILPATVGQTGFCKVYGKNSFEQVPIILALRFTQGGSFSMIPVRTSSEPVKIASTQKTKTNLEAMVRQERRVAP